MKTLAYKTFALLLLLASCKEARESIEETLHPKEQKEQPAPANTTVIVSSSGTFSSTTHIQHFESIFNSATALDSIQQELKVMPALKGKKLFFLRGFYFYDYKGGMISIDLQDPDKPENIDTYTYSNGKWQLEKPVQITGHYPLKMLLMPLDEVKFSIAKKVYDTGMEKSATIEGAQPVTHVYFNHIGEVHVKEWYIMLSGARHNYRLTFDVNGKFKAME